MTNRTEIHRSPRLARQIARYAASGVFIAMLYAAIYWLLVTPAQASPYLANTSAWLAALVTGYLLHSRWTFGGYGRRDRPIRTGLTFLIINIVGYGVNNIWVWLLVDLLGLDVRAPILPILFITPWLSFYANRRWAFG